MDSDSSGEDKIARNRYSREAQLEDINRAQRRLNPGRRSSDDLPNIPAPVRQPRSDNNWAWWDRNDQAIEGYARRFYEEYLNLVDSNVGQSGTQNISTQTVYTGDFLGRSLSPAERVRGAPIRQTITTTTPRNSTGVMINTSSGINPTLVNQTRHVSRWWGQTQYERMPEPEPYEPLSDEERAAEMAQMQRLVRAFDERLTRMTLGADHINVKLEVEDPEPSEPFQDMLL